MALIKSVRGFSPVIGQNCFLAENATIVGEVVMGNFCSVWFNAVIRGDVHYIHIGNYTNIQDGAIIHCTYQTSPTKIGNHVSIGHGAMVHGCTLEDKTLVGMGAIVMDNAVVQTESIVAAGSIVLENTIVESGFLYAGIPAKKIKPLDDKLKAMLNRISNNYPKYASWFMENQEQ